MIIERAELRKVLTQAKKAQGRSSIEVLRGIRIRTTEEGVCFETTDMDIYAELHPVCESVSNLDAIVELAALARVAKDIPYRRVCLEQTADGTLIIYNRENGETPVTLPVRPVGDWPARPAPEVKDTKCVCVLTLDDLAAVRHSIVPAASKDESRPVLTQVQLDVNGRARFASTDSYRLHMLDLPKAQCLMDGTAILSARLLRIAYDVANHYDAQPITITCGERWSTVSVDGEDMLTCRTVDGQYPQVDKLMPDFRDSSRIIRVQREPLIAALKMAAIDTEKNKPVGISIDLLNEIEVVSITSGQRFPVTVTSNLAGQGASGQNLPIEMGVNAEFMVAALEALDTNEPVTLTVLTPLRPFTIVGKDVCTLVMPIRLQGDFPQKKTATRVALKGGSKPVAEVVAEARAKRDAGKATIKATPRAKDLPPARFATEADKAIDKYKGNVPRMKYAKALRDWHLGQRKTEPRMPAELNHRMGVNTADRMSAIAIECGIHKIGGK